MSSEAKAAAFDALKAEWEGPGAVEDWLEFCQDFDWEPSTPAVKAGDGWIRCSERMPDEGRIVLFWHESWGQVQDVVGFGRFRRDDEDGDWWEDISQQDMSGDSEIYYSGVTHWQPLPAPPSPETNGEA